jgi:CHAT domain-containing protein
VPRSLEQHLNADELDQILLFGTCGGEAMEHLPACEMCAAKLRLLRKGQAMLVNLGASSSSPERRCPPASVWWNIAEGAANEQQTAEWLGHAAGCDACNRELKAALDPDPVAEDQEGTKLDRPEARRRLAQQMAESFRKQSGARRTRNFPQSLRAVAAVLAALAVGLAYWLTRPTPAQLIAKAYAKDRTVELRIPGAGHGRLNIERGGTPGVARSVELLDAELRVVSGLERQPGSPALLELKARIELLRWEYKSAFSILTLERQRAPGDLDGMLDLSLALFERAEAEQNQSDYGRALELLSTVIAKDPANKTALFNRAIVQERLHMFQEAREDWEKYLQVDPRGAWADEARERLAAIRKLSEDRQRKARPCSTLTAEELLSWADDIPRRVDHWEGSWECLRERALAEWLPKAATSEPERRALNAAASAFHESAADSFLFDVMEHSTQRPFAAAAQQLATAVAANLTLESGRAETAANQARRMFRALGNRAGEVQALRELAYTARRFQNAQACRIITNTLPAAGLDKRWPWLAAQVQLEVGACFALLGDYESARRAASAVAAQTQNPVFASLHLRAQSYLESYGYFTGDFLAAWKFGQQGLDVYWNGNFQHVWGYQLYYNLAAAALKNRQYHLAARLQQEALAEIELSGRPSLAAFTWFDYGRTALLAGSIAEARHALAVSAERFSQLKNDDAVSAAIAECEIHLAEIENLEGHPYQARARLDRVADSMNKIHQISASLRYGRAAAEADRLLHLDADYRDQVRRLVNLAELGVASLSDFGAQTQWLRDTSDIYRGLVDVAAQDGHAEQALDNWEWTQAAPFRARTGAPAKVETLDVALRAKLVRAPSAANILTRAGVDQALVYASVRGRVIVWYIRGGGVSMHTIETPSDEIDRLARELYALCSTPSSSRKQIAAVSGKLSAALIRPIEREVAWAAPLSVELDDSLAPIPFAVLRLSSGDFIGEHCPIAMFPAAAYLAPRRDRTRSLARGPILAVGLSTARGISLPPLRTALAEAAEGASRFGSSRVLLNGEATLSAIKREIDGAVVFQFAGHSQNSADRAALLIAATTEDGPAPGILDASDILSMNLNHCQLAIVSTCSGEAPDLFQESRPFGFALALLRRGVPAVLTTRWNLDSTAGLRFVNEFYDHLLAGQTAVLAAQSAATALRRDELTRHPYFWAAYQFFGT